jgi:hypothetical protein
MEGQPVDSPHLNHSQELPDNKGLENDPEYQNQLKSLAEVRKRRKE